ncbi:MAG: hypothetical protein CVV64_17480 [Candidatus Wallbacteria bacterium HGW-Wallbacteria-1]|jgi:hypothetical protein|uniref:Methyltransferase type 11 domain-containing protein n=1 Tax=Candidatus Wallbacteria bacterium HGW-Wallbacteria-1 TaxID=2013854 RepID=A0A2N1PK34_9BACT|nr:MAG: hypothetical protein CVV64_17480 [Candidatus Wallbacteria bacterium HGW-Wallbacteria-1]
MMNKNEFRKIYLETAEKLIPLITTEIQTGMAAHNPLWSRNANDFSEYIRKSWIRYWIALEGLISRERTPINVKVCDVGGFLGIFPLTLKKLGFKSVCMTETLEYYGDCMTPIFELLTSAEVEIIDFDPFSHKIPPMNDSGFTTCMAILEHYPHSPRQFMDQVTSITKSGGLIHIEVPNIAYFPKRMNFLMGRTPLVDIAAIHRAKVPFTGHHHEYTMAELTELLTLHDLKILRRECYTYSIENPDSLRFMLRHPLLHVSQKYFPDTREVLSALALKV